jgi:hypothetical protein
MNKEAKMWTAISLGFVLLAISFAERAFSQNEVKYCKDHVTGQVITVEATMPCPYPMVEL